MILSIVIILLSVVVDQVSKHLCVTYLEPIGTFPIIEDILHLTYVENRGAAFGMLSDSRWVFMVLSVVGIAAMIFWLIKFKPENKWLVAAISLIIGGGIGNMIDRVMLGYVVDMIDCRFIDFYVFNIADSCVCVGCALAFIAVVVDEVRADRAKKAEDENAGA